MDLAGMADTKGGKVAIGEAENFERSKAYKEGRQVIFHEIGHLLGSTDKYPPNGGFPGTTNSNNAMYFISPDNKRQLTSEQVVREIMNSTVGSIYYLFS